jgi:Ser/Thr protein kinase RdoA (MazF antagonist)
VVAQLQHLWDLDGYRFTAMGGATQATVWRGTAGQAGRPDVAVRLTPKPAGLIHRIGEAVNAVTAVPVPRTLAVAAGVDGRTAHLCTWVGAGPVTRPDDGGVGRQVALLHQALTGTGADFTDRPLQFDRDTPGAGRPAWWMATDVWLDRVRMCLDDPGPAEDLQATHGDLHWGNLVQVGSTVGFIDFDKVMHTRRVFDLAKLIATGLFRISGGRVVFQVRRARRLLAGYEAVQALTDDELGLLEGYVQLLNEQTGILGLRHGAGSYTAVATAVARWWIHRRSQAPADPLGIRAGRGGR